MLSISVFLISCASNEAFFPKENKIVVIGKGNTLGELGNEAYLFLEVFEKYNLGGQKICYELAADINEIKNSNHILAGDTIIFYSLPNMGVKLKNLDKNNNNLPALMVNGKIKFIRGTGGGFWETLVRGLATGKIKFRLTLENTLDTDIEVKIEQGDLFETTNPDSNPQNLVATENFTFKIEANTRQKIELTGYCTNEGKSMPDNEPIKPTPLYINSNVVTSKDGVWNYFRSLKQKR